LRAAWCAFGLLVALGGCAPVGPDFSAPEAPVLGDWYQSLDDGLNREPVRADWWQTFEDPVLTELVLAASTGNYSLRAAGLNVLAARAQLGIAVGSRYPQLQRATGAASMVSGSENAANTGGGDLAYSQYSVNFETSWEIDFWGRFRRGIEAADASLSAAVANYDNALVLLLAQVATTYTELRASQEELRIARENLELQRRSYQIADVLYRNGENDELDMQQAKTLLLSTESSIPALEASVYQAQNALAVLVGRPAGELSALLAAPAPLPAVPADIAIGIPADLLRQRPDVREAEFEAAAQSARIGIALADLYPSIGLSGTLGLTAAGATATTRTGNSGLAELADRDSLSFVAGPGASWNILNYGRLRNNVRVQDARLQQLLEVYRGTVLRAGQEVEDAIAALLGYQRQYRILGDVVGAAKRSSELALLRYREGLADYQRVLDSQQSLFAQQQRYVRARAGAVNSLVALYKALGGGWQIREGRPFVDQDTQQIMRERTDWGRLLEPGALDPPRPGSPRSPDW